VFEDKCFCPFVVIVGISVNWNLIVKGFGGAEAFYRMLVDLQHVLIIIKADLHYGNYRSKLVHFEAQKKYFLCLKNPSLERFLL
jgi:hypothetical protein